MCWICSLINDISSVSLKWRLQSFCQAVCFLFMFIDIFIMLQLLPRFSSPSTWLLYYINIFCEMALISVVSWFSIMLHDLLNHIIYGLCCHFFFLIFLVNKDTFLKSDSLFCLSTLKNIHSLSTRSEPSITLTILLVIFISLCWYNQKLTRDTLNPLMQK